MTAAAVAHSLECDLDFLRPPQRLGSLLDGATHESDDPGDWPFLKAGDAFPAPLVVTKRPAWTRRLVITKQPASEFYKDEGGKANALEVEVTLVEFNELGEPARTPDDEFIDIPLRILLFFESGKRVDDTDQEIFRFVGNDYDSVVIRNLSRKASVQFRLEKVSRRKDGQRFKLRIEVDQEQCTANVSDLTPIFTNAICVLSKRKHHHAFASESAIRTKEPAPKLLKRDLVKLDEKLSSKVDAMVAEMAQVKYQLQKQTHSHHSHQQQLHSHVQHEHEQQQQQSALAYLTSSDDAYETEEPLFSPASSDMSVVEILPSSLTFAEF
ncbi:hypothetical protein PybrP1_001580 [[Pythium] brassicae (nom. inval.)]|nr:hypothetical protein PybrP1_001580 [[Pythium] brassicae (nom. inval.)]